MKRKETDGKFAVTKFLRVKEFESAANDRTAFLDACDTIGEDGTLFSAPNGFAGFSFQKQLEYACDMFGRQPIEISLPVTINA